MRSGVPQGSVIRRLLFPLFVNGLSGALEVLKLLFAKKIKIVTHWARNINLPRSFITVSLMFYTVCANNYSTRIF